VLGWATIVVLLAFRQFRRLFGFLDAFSVKESVAAILCLGCTRGVLRVSVC
jgi:hypothetical protein